MKFTRKGFNFQDRIAILVLKSQGKVKAKFTLEQAMKAQRANKCVALVFL
jgi:hypothetical protein